MTITHGTITANEQIGNDNYTTIRLHPDCDHYPQGEVTITPQTDWLQARRGQQAETELRQWCFEQTNYAESMALRLADTDRLYDYLHQASTPDPKDKP